MKQLQRLVEEIFGLEHIGMRLRLEVIEEIMVALGNPHKQLKYIHITGTNGKGSTSAFIATVLQIAGYKVGLYTSPHMYRYNERIRINNKPITDKDLLALILELKAVVKKHNIQPAFFEFTTALAFMHFVRNKIDIAVIEVGMGGRLDATNIISPLLSVITNIHYDHMKYLGSDLLSIAKEKAGIIKSGCPLVTAEKNPEIISYFQSVCKEKKSECILVNSRLCYEIVKSDLSHQVFSTSGNINDTFEIKLLGEHQCQNACTAIVALTELRNKGIVVSDSAIKEGLKKTKWEGRMQIISKKPLIIVDGAHNVAGITQLCTFVRSFPRRNVLVIAIASGKDMDEMTRLIVPLFDRIIITRGLHRASTTSDVAAFVKKYTSSFSEIADPAEAVRKGLCLLEENDTMVVTGSLYMIPAALSTLRKELSIRTTGN